MYKNRFEMVRIRIGRIGTEYENGSVSVIFNPDYIIGVLDNKQRIVIDISTKIAYPYVETISLTTAKERINFSKGNMVAMLPLADVGHYSEKFANIILQNLIDGIEYPNVNHVPEKVKTI